MSKDLTQIKTRKALKASGYVSRSIKEELRSNLLTMIEGGRSAFEGIHGYENTVIPDLERAILSGHNINFLGLRGQAKTRLARQMTGLLDEYIPVIEGAPLNDDPLNPISQEGKALVAQKGDDCPVSWLHRDQRYFEKLATPDVTVADLIGDIDPIKAANLKLAYSDQRTIHFGMIPRAHRCIFVINELPDLQARIQVALFNILQEGDIQIRGFQLRLNLDLQFVFTANPEDYTNRGAIVTPLKDRIGSQILTHYPESINTARQITAQEAKLTPDQKKRVEVPDLAYSLLEQIAFTARENEFIDAKSGVSARLTISALENLISTAERRALLNQEKKTKVRLNDFLGVLPAITGKVELVYEGEQEGAYSVAENLLGDAVKALYPENFPALDKLKNSDAASPYKALVDWFGQGKSIDLLNDFSDKEYQGALDQLAPLKQFAEAHFNKEQQKDRYFYMEVILWALVEHHKLSKEKLRSGWQFSDLFGSYLRGGDIEI